MQIYEIIYPKTSIVIIIIEWAHTERMSRVRRGPRKETYATFLK